MKKYTCPCCGLKTFSEPNGSYEICLVCAWQDDGVMNDNPDYWGGANQVCLRQAQRNYIKFGVSEKRFIGRLVRKNYEKDPLWKPVWEKELTQGKDKSLSIKIEGNILKNGFQQSIGMDEFLDEFVKLLESNGWAFGGDIIKGK
ncbi:hypothetical protein ABID96_001095 [Bacillus sp. OAE603]